MEAAGVAAAEAVAEAVAEAAAEAVGDAPRFLSPRECALTLTLTLTP